MDGFRTPEGDTLAEFLSDLRALKRTSCTVLKELHALPGTRGRSQLSAILRGQTTDPPDRDLILIMVRFMLNRTVGTAALDPEMSAWARRYDALFAAWEKAAFAPVVDADVQTRVPDDSFGQQGFVGRVREMRILDQFIDGAVGESRFVFVSAVAGTAGVGKTSLVREWSSRVVDEFPGGVAIIDMGGYSTDGFIEASDGLKLLLRRFGVKGPKIKATYEGRVEQLRWLTRRGRTLVVWDNARDAHHVAPLLLKLPDMVVLVTSRDALDGLAEQHSVTRVDLDRLSLAQSLDLLCAHLSADVEATPDQLTELARLCVRLPLALRIAASALSRPGRTVGELIDELRDHRLAALDSGRWEGEAPRTLFSWSYRHLPAEEKEFFRAVGVHPGRGRVDAYSIAAMKRLPVTVAKSRLNGLQRSHLVERTPTGAYRIHDLLREYATELAEDVDGRRQVRAQLDRLARYQIYVTSQAMNVVAGFEAGRRPVVRRPRQVDVPPVADREAAGKWLREERENLLATAERAMKRRLALPPATLAGLVFRILDSEGMYEEALRLHRYAVEVLRHRGDDPKSLALALRDLGMTLERMGEYDEAQRALLEARSMLEPGSELRCYAEASLGLVYYRTGQNLLAIEELTAALPLAEELGHPQLVGTILRNLAVTYWRLARYEEGAATILRAVESAERSGDQTLFAFALTNHGLAISRESRFDEAIAVQERAITVAGSAVSGAAKAALGYALTNIGLVRLRSGDVRRSLDEQRTAYRVASAVGHQSLLVYAQMNLGLSQFASGDLAEAREWARLAAAGALSINDIGVAAEALNLVGEVAFASGSLSVAQLSHHRSLGIAIRAGDLAETARARAGLASVYREMGRESEAEANEGEARRIRRRIGDPLDSIPVRHRA